VKKEDLYKKFDNDMEKRSRLSRLGLSLDQFLNVLLLNGSEDETISSHIGRRQIKGTATWVEKKLCWLLDKIEKNHCNKSLGE